MRVHDSNLNSVTIGTHESGRAGEVRGERGGVSGAQGQSGQDRISLSDFGNLLRSVSSDSPARAAKVNQLAADYQSGSYRVVAQAVSKGIVNDALQPR